MAAHPEAEDVTGAGPPVTSPGPQPGAPGMPRHPLSVPSRGRRRRSPARVAVLGGLIALLAILIAFVVVSIFTPFKGDGTGRVVVTIPAGSSAREVGDLLADKGVVGSGLFFSLRASIGGDRDKLRAGRFVLRRDMSNGAAITALTTPPQGRPGAGPADPRGPEPPRDRAAGRQGGRPGRLPGRLQAQPVLNPRDLSVAPRGSPNLEGFLFPATYWSQARVDARTLVAQQLHAPSRRTSRRCRCAKTAKNLTRYDVLIIASMIEREAPVARERRLIAAVIYNRLKQGIPLGIDATTRYDNNNWTRPLEGLELTATAVQHHAAQGPAADADRQPRPRLDPRRGPPREGKVLFFVASRRRIGAHAFSSTNAQFEADVAAYNRRRAELGGKDPSTCPK